ncbi:quinone oxidoreductase-like protein 1 [Thrips palmi]|uniref:Quinone oxidoreductase-like protein 1 n=1 Tax=Thrips palmi TaxID=161013 RepID=A0A6P8ZZ60_THRPL|nr:quinone oxidoreductase-like protein 1 [Thrips palmi]
MTKFKSTKTVFVEINNGSNLNFTEVDQAELPDLERNSVLIQVKACSLSSWLHCCGNVGKDPATEVLCQAIGKIGGNPNKSCKLPAGQDIAGVVKAVGEDVTTLAKGDYVVGIIPLDYGQSGCADFVVLQEFDVVHIPDGVSFVDAAGCVGDAVKAYIALHYMGRLGGSDDTVLVLNGATSLGSTLLQLAHHWGARVMTSCSSNDEKTYIQSLGVPLLQVVELNEKNQSLKAACNAETGNLGVNIIIDTIASLPTQMDSNIIEEEKVEPLVRPTKHDIISCLAVGGRWVTCEPNLQLDPPNSKLLFLRCASVGFLCEQAWMLSHAQQGRYQHILMDIMRKVGTGIIRPNIHHTVTFDGVKDALKHLPKIRVGKVVLTL